MVFSCRKELVEVACRGYPRASLPRPFEEHREENFTHAAYSLFAIQKNAFQVPKMQTVV